MSMSFRSTCLSVVLTFTFAGAASAGPLTPSFGENTSAFSLTVLGGPFDSDDFHPFVLGSLWKVNVNILEDAGFVNDLLNIRWTAQHVRGPHGEGLNINIFDDVFSVDADLFATGTHSLPTKSLTVDHQIPGHEDSFTATLSFDVSSTLGIDDITGYTFKLIGTHCSGASAQEIGVLQTCPGLPEEHPIPEPTTILLLATGLAGVHAVRRKRRH
jgi:hypothetical protein